MDRFFDAFLYTANWGTNVLKLRVPTKLLSRAKVRAYCAGDAITARQNRRNTMVTLTSNDESADWLGDDYSLGSMISIRNDLVRGDLRALYLGWLAAVQNDCVDENTLEPEVPAGLRDLDASLQALVEFLRIEDGLLRAAASESKTLPPPPKLRELTAWVAALPTTKKNAVLVRLLADDPRVALELRDRFRAEQRGKAIDPRRVSRRRRVRDLVS